MAGVGGGPVGEVVARLPQGLAAQREKNWQTGKGCWGGGRDTHTQKYSQTSPGSTSTKRTLLTDRERRLGWGGGGGGGEWEGEKERERERHTHTGRNTASLPQGLPLAPAQREYFWQTRKGGRGTHTHTHTHTHTDDSWWWCPFL